MKPVHLLWAAIILAVIGACYFFYQVGQNSEAAALSKPDTMIIKDCAPVIKI